MKRDKILEVVDRVIEEMPHLKKNEALVYEITKQILIVQENELMGK